MWVPHTTLGHPTKFVVNFSSLTIIIESDNPKLMDNILEQGVRDLLTMNLKSSAKMWVIHRV